MSGVLSSLASCVSLANNVPSQQFVLTGLEALVRLPNTIITIRKLKTSYQRDSDAVDTASKRRKKKNGKQCQQM